MVLLRTVSLTVYRKRTNIPVYSFEQHQRLDETVSLYSPHVVILEGILALHDPPVLDMLDMKIYVEADADLCLSRRSMCFPRSAQCFTVTNAKASKSCAMCVKEAEQLKV